MLEHTRRFVIEAPPAAVWRALHPKPPAGHQGPRVIEYGGVRIEIVHEGDENGEGLVRTCTFRVPRWLLTGGVGLSWECVTEVRPGEYSRYFAVGKPLWSRAEGWHRLEDLGDGRTRLTFGESYLVFNPLLRATLARRVHNFISRDNDRLIMTALERCGRVTKVNGDG